MKMKSASQKHLASMVLATLLVALGFVLAIPVMTAKSLGSKTPFNLFIPVGTIFPTRLENMLSAEDVKAGEEIATLIMQDVPLDGREKIRARSKVLGTVVTVARTPDGNAIDVSLRFDKVEYDKKTIPVSTSLRAIASYEAVRAAQTPFTGADGGTPAGWANTVQIGGDIRYGDSGEVRNRKKQKVGKGVEGGVLVHVSAQPGSACDGEIAGNDRMQALWVFSADACGLFGYRHIQIIHNGRKDPVGVISLRFEKEKMKLDAHTAILLRTVAAQ